VLTLSLSERLRKVNAGKRYQFVFPLLGLLLLAASASAMAFKVLSANTYLQGEVYRLNAAIEWHLSRSALDALQNGVALNLRLQLEVLHSRAWLWDESIASIRQRFRLEYHALARQYVVTNVNTGQFRSFPDRAAALDSISHIRDFPLLDRSLVTPSEKYYVELRALLDVGALPAPLRALANLSGEWRLSSEWYTCPLS
jgi:hypothetical protein